MLSETWSLFIGLEICKRCRFCAAGWFKKNPKNKYLGDCQAKLTKKVLSVWRFHTLRALSRPSFLRGAQVCVWAVRCLHFSKGPRQINARGVVYQSGNERGGGIQKTSLFFFVCLLKLRDVAQLSFPLPSSSSPVSSRLSRKRHISCLSV